MGNRYRLGCLVLVLGVSVLATGAVVGCSYLLLRQPDPIELKRVASPDGVHDAVLLKIPPRFSGGGAAGSTGHYELFVVEAGKEAPYLPRRRATGCKETGEEEGTLRICQGEPADPPGSESRLFTTDAHLGSTGYEIRWQDGRTLEFRDYEAGEVLEFGCSPYPRELVYTTRGGWSTKMPDDVCAAVGASPETT